MLISMYVPYPIRFHSFRNALLAHTEDQTPFLNYEVRCVCANYLTEQAGYRGTQTAIANNVNVIFK